MSKHDLTISRRRMLQGAGAMLALPCLQAMLPRTVYGGLATAAAPTRMAVLFMPNGVHPDMWTPTGEGADYQLSPTLAPLADYRSDIQVLSNLWNAGSKTGDGHYVKTSGFLTCTTINKTVGADLNCNGVSLDQVVAQKLGKYTPLPSLELGTEPVATGIDTVVGYTRVYGAHIAWKGPRSPLAKEINPRLVFERMFRATQGQSADTAQRDASILDLVLDDARRLRQQLGAEDRRRVDEYLQSVRTLEERLAAAENPERQAWQPRAAVDSGAKPVGIPKEHAEHVQLMLDMIALAFQTDSTRVCTFMFGNSVSNKNFSFLEGVSGAHHSLSHHQNEEDKMRQYQRINLWHMEQLAYLLGKLKSMPEGESNVLDNSMILFGSGLRDGQRHDPHNLPIVLAGRAGGMLQAGAHRNYSKDTPLANLYLSMLSACGIKQDRFADSTGELQGVLA